MKTIKFILFLGIIIISVFACKKDGMFNQALVPYGFPSCKVSSDIKMPKGFTFTQLSQIEYKGGFQELHFFDDNTGFLYGRNTFGGYPAIFKTEDGGKSWTNLNITIPESPISIAFKDKNIGFISIFDSKGCPSNCQNRTLLMKTIDGGKTWQRNEYPNYKGQLSHIQFDKQGNMYAALVSYENSSKTVKMLKSVDDGNTWNLLYESSELDFVYVTFSFLLKKDVLYISGKSGKIIKIDINGNYLETLETGYKAIYPLTLINDDTFLMDNFSGLVKSTNGGKTWKDLTIKNTQILHFKSPDEGLVVMNEDYCGAYDYPNYVDVIAHTTDGGLTWTKSEQIQDVVNRFVDSYKTSDGRLIVVLGLKVFEIKEQ
jgi:photosystem II stability/assembly factor-like uncharacterized protein